MREIWVDFYYYDNEYGSTEDSINKYFMYLTLAYKNAANRRKKVTSGKTAQGFGAVNMA